MQVENSVIQDYRSGSLGKPYDAKELPSCWNFQTESQLLMLSYKI